MDFFRSQCSQKKSASLSRWGFASLCAKVVSRLVLEPSAERCCVEEVGDGDIQTKTLQILVKDASTEFYILSVHTTFWPGGFFDVFHDISCIFMEPNEYSTARERLEEIMTVSWCFLFLLPSLPFFVWQIEIPGFGSFSVPNTDVLGLTLTCWVSDLHTTFHESGTCWGSGIITKCHWRPSLRAECTSPMKQEKTRSFWAYGGQHWCQSSKTSLF